MEVLKKAAPKKPPKNVFARDTAKISEKEIQNNENQEITWFWSKDSEKNFCRVNHTKFIQFLETQGFGRYELENGYIYIYEQNNQISEVTPNYIQDHFLKFLNEFFDNPPENYDPDKNGTKELVSEVFYRNPQTYFSDAKLSLLQAVVPDFKRDTADSAFFYYINGFVKVDKTGLYFFDYFQLKGKIWKKQILPRNYATGGNSEKVFEKFVFNISGKKEQRFKAIKTIIGFLLHNYFDYKLFAVNFTDSQLSDFDEGRTGKTILGRAIGQMRNQIEIAGKTFDPTNERKYRQLNIQTQNVHINDARNNLYFEALFNDITDGIKVLNLYKEPFNIFCKMLISSNKPLAVYGASATARVVEFEFSDYYSKDYSPENEFKMWFFRDWSADDWADFDGFMLRCSLAFFQFGVIKPEEINLAHRKLIKDTSREFFHFMEDSFYPTNGISDFGLGKEFLVRDLYQKFQNDYSENFEHQKILPLQTFTKNLSRYAQLKQLRIIDRRSGAKRYMIIEKIEK